MRTFLFLLVTPLATARERLITYAPWTAWMIAPTLLSRRRLSHAEFRD
jgi:hypothetical protein